jgi:hypothetical protein
MSMSSGAPGPEDPGGTAVPSEQGWAQSDADQESLGAAGDEGPGNSGYGHGRGRHRRDDDEDDERNVGG